MTENISLDYLLKNNFISGGQECRVKCLDTNYSGSIQVKENKVFLVTNHPEWSTSPVEADTPGGFVRMVSQSNKKVL